MNGLPSVSAESAEEVLEKLVEEARHVPSNQFERLLRSAFALGRAHELTRAAFHAARALEELAEPDKPTAHPEWESALFGLGGGPFEC